jgi:hypothetical protein
MCARDPRSRSSDLVELSGSRATRPAHWGNLRDLALDQPPVPIMFRPYAQLSDRAMTEVVRTRGDPAAAAAGVRREMWSVDRNAALEFKPLRRALSDSTLRPRAGLAIVTAFALVAMICDDYRRIRSLRFNQLSREPASAGDRHPPRLGSPGRLSAVERPEALSVTGSLRAGHRFAVCLCALRIAEVVAL